MSSESRPSILKFTRPADQGADHAASRVADDEAVQSPTPAATEKPADTPAAPDVQEGGRRPAEPQPEPTNDPQQPPEPLFDIDTPAPPVPVIDKELENLLKKVQPIVVDPNNLDDAAGQLHHYQSRSLVLQRGSRKSAVLAGVYDWQMGDGFAQVYEVLAPRKEWMKWKKNHQFKDDYVDRCLRLRAAFDDPRRLCQYDSLGAMDAAAKAILAAKRGDGSWKVISTNTATPGDRGESAAEPTETAAGIAADHARKAKPKGRKAGKGRKERGKGREKLDLGGVPNPVVYVEELAKAKYTGLELLDQIPESLNLAAERGGVSDKQFLELAVRALYCCERRRVEKNDWARDQSILDRDLDKLLEVLHQYVRHASPAWRAEAAALFVQTCGDVSENAVESTPEQKSEAVPKAATAADGENDAGGVVLKEPAPTPPPQAYRHHPNEINQPPDLEQYQPEEIPAQKEEGKASTSAAPSEEDAQQRRWRFRGICGPRRNLPGRRRRTDE